ncbi:MAG: hypothetical protein Q9227_006219 [Pyrenula ochraceoflavens]
MRVMYVAVFAFASLVLGHGHSQHHVHQGMDLKRGAADGVMGSAVDGLQSIVANATQCGCSTFLTTLLGGLASAQATTVTTVFTTSYSVETVYITENATEPAIPSETVSTTVSTSSVQNSYDTTTTTTVYHFKTCSSSTALANPVSASSSSSVEAVLPPPGSSSTRKASVVSPLESVSIASASDRKGYASYSSLSSAEKALDATASLQLFAPSPSSDSLPNPWAISYDAYVSTSSQQHCKGPVDIIDDIKTIAAKGFSTVRLYSTDCSILTIAGPVARSLNIKLIPCIWLDGDLNRQHAQIADVTNWAQWDLVPMIIVGNEAINEHHLPSIDMLVQTINSARESFRAAGYAGAVTTAETINVWQQNADKLCDAVDIAGANIHPFFDPHTEAKDAGPFVLSQLMTLHKVCPGKSIVNLETGWPSAGNGCQGKACPGVQEQKDAITSLRSLDPRVQSVLCYFSWVDELWKDPGLDSVEHHWGLKELF